MILNTISLENVRSYVSQTISFPQGLILLTGDIGSGKSTILQAVEFALFGIIRGELDGTALLRHGTQRGSVTLDCTIESNTVKIHRTLVKTKTSVNQDTGYIILNGEKQELSASEMRAMILDLLAYPQEQRSKALYRYTVYTSQERMKDIIQENAETRLQTLRTVFNVDKYKRLKENALIYHRHLREKMQFFEGQAVGISDLEEKHQQIQVTLNELQLKQTQTQKNQQSVQKELRSLLTKMQSLEEKRKHVAALKQNIATLDAKTNHIKEQKYFLSEQINTKREEQETIQKQLLTKEVILDEKKLLIQKEKLQSQLHEYHTQHTVLEQQLQATDSSLSQAFEELQTVQIVQSEFDELQSQLTNVNSDVKELESQVQDHATVSDQILKLKQKNAIISSRVEERQSFLQSMHTLTQCPLCLTPMDDSHKVHVQSEYTKLLAHDQTALNALYETLKTLAEKEKDLIQKERNYTTATTKKERIKAQLAVLEKQLARKTEIHNQHQRLKHQQITVQEELKLLKKIDVEQLQKDITLLEQKIEQSKEQQIAAAKREQLLAQDTRLSQDIAQLREQVANNSQELEVVLAESKKTKDELLQFIDLETELQELQHDQSHIQKQVTELTSAVASLGTSIQANRNSLQELDSDLQKKKQAKSKAQYVKMIRTWLHSGFVPLMEVLEQTMLQSVYTEFNALFSRWFNLLIEDDTIAARLDQTFTPVIEQNGYEVSVNHLSGGERTSVALAYRLSLNKVINDVISDIRTKDLLILDEPTDGFSTEQLDKVKEVLQQLAVKQLIIVSHEPKMESVVDHVLSINKQEQVSSVE